MVRSRHIDQPVKPSRTKNRRINNVRPVRRTNNDNIDQRLYPVQLRQQLANHPLRDAAIAKTHAPPRNHRVELVEEDDRRSSSPPLTKHLPDSLLRLAHPLAEQFGSLDRDEVRLTLRRHSPRQHSLPTTRRPEQQNTLRRPNTHPGERLRLLQRPLNSLLKLLFNISKPANVRPRYRRHLDVDLPHRGRRDLPIRVREILNVDFHLLQDATGDPFFLEIDLWKISSQRFHRSFTAERRNVRPRVAVANIRQPVKIHIRSQWHCSSVNL